MTPEEMLEQLAEFQAQADLLELNRQELIDSVKVPDEVLAAQKEANERRQKLDSELWTREKRYDAMTADLLAAIVDPPMPPEFVAAKAEADRKRQEIVNKATHDEDEDRKAVQSLKAKIDADLQAQIAEVYNQVAIRKQEINDEFSEKASGVLDNIAKLTADVKAEVIKVGKSVKGSVYQAVFVKGRVTWNTDMLDGMIIAYPELGKARKEGQPSVTLRKN